MLYIIQRNIGTRTKKNEAQENKLKKNETWEKTSKIVKVTT